MNPLPVVTFVGGVARLVRSVPSWPGALAEVPHVLLAARRLVDEARAALSEVDRVIAEAAAVADRAGAVTGAADALRARIADVTEDAGVVVDGAATCSTRLDPLLAAVAEVDPDTVRQAVRLSDRLRPLLEAISGLNAAIAVDTGNLVHQLPGILDQLDSAVIPALDEMRKAVPDVRALLPLVEEMAPVLTDVETRLAGLPGSSVLRRRGRRQLAEDGVTTDDDGARVGPAADAHDDR